MKTRIIQTRFWDDEFIAEADIFTQHLYLYLLTSQYINISGMFQLSPKKIQFESKLTENQFQQASACLEKAGKVYFKNGWVYVVNARKNNNYLSKTLNQKAYEKELERVPKEILDWFLSDKPVVTEYQVSTDTVHINHKPKTINHKQETRNKKEGYEKIISHFNETFEKTTKSYAAWQSGCDYWLEQYSLEDILQAISNWKNYNWWAKENPNLQLLFRTKNKNGQCDYIDELLNLKPKERVLDPLVAAHLERTKGGNRT